MLALAISVSAALPVFWKKNRPGADFGVIAFGTLVTGWFAWRAWISPVAELGQADLLLLTGVVGAFISIRAIERNELAERILTWGIALLLLANVVVVGIQVIDPAFAPVFRSRASIFPSGFYAQYNEAANYLIASTLLVAAAAFFGNQGMATRILWALIAIAGLVAVYFTRSRGGILGAAVGIGVFAIISLMIGQREKARWFAPALIAIPVIGLLVGGFLYQGWQASQELRQSATGMTGILDNNCRLHFLGISLSCIALHPMFGGGSRSFSWESFRFFESNLHGESTTHLPEQVHNELLQTATDYGLIGTGLLIGLLGTLVVVAVVRILFSEALRESAYGDAWRLGGLAALAGMFVQSSFSFVFHLLPGALLLGICLGKMLRAPAGQHRPAQRIGSKILLSVGAIACVILLLPYGWNGSRVTGILWSSYLGKAPVTSAESKVAALTEAIRIWPQTMFYKDRAAILQEMSAGATGTATVERAIQDYEKAEQLHPYDPTPVINRASSLSQLLRNPDAEAAYDRAIHLQGGMEPAFRGRFLLANHLMRKGLRQFSAGKPSPALASLEIAAQQMEQSVREMHWVIADMVEPRVFIHESLGVAREANGDNSGAMEAYNFAATLQAGTRAHYRAGVLYGKMASAAWAARRPEEALGYFIEAKNRIGQATELPSGITPSQRVELLHYLDQSIAFLKGAKIEPALPAQK